RSPTFDSVRCRVQMLQFSLSAQVTGNAEPRLSRVLGTAAARVRKAQEAAQRGRITRARRLLRTGARRLLLFADRLPMATGSAMSGEVRDALAVEARTIRDDLRALRRSM